MAQIQYTKPKITKKTQQYARGWVKALRSGKYTQAREEFVEDGHEGRKHCCLAVLEEQYGKTTSTGRPRPGKQASGSPTTWKKLGMGRDLVDEFVFWNDGVDMNLGYRIGARRSYEWIAKKIEKLWEL